eukprot:4723906-Amphidinium_carterae.1
MLVASQHPRLDLKGLKTSGGNTEVSVRTKTFRAQQQQKHRHCCESQNRDVRLAGALELIIEAGMQPRRRLTIRWGSGTGIGL